MTTRHLSHQADKIAHEFFESWHRAGRKRAHGLAPAVPLYTTPDQGEPTVGIGSFGLAMHRNKFIKIDSGRGSFSENRPGKCRIQMIEMTIMMNQNS